MVTPADESHNEEEDRIVKYRMQVARFKPGKHPYFIVSLSVNLFVC